MEKKNVGKYVKRERRERAELTIKPESLDEVLKDYRIPLPGSKIAVTTPAGRQI
jgi:hypothetical protein